MNSPVPSDMGDADNKGSFNGCMDQLVPVTVFHDACSCPGVFLLQEQCGQTSGESSGCKKWCCAAGQHYWSKKHAAWSSRAEMLHQKLLLLLFYFAGPSRSLVPHGTEIRCSQILKAEITESGSLLAFFSYPYGVGRGRKVAIVRILLLRRSSVPLWAALLGTCITEQSLLQCMGLHWECARTKRLMLPKLWMITSPFLPAWIGHNACCPVYAALLHLSPTPLLCGVFFFFQMHLGIQSWEQNRCWFIPSGRELLPSSFSLMKLLQCCLPGWTCPFIPI